MRNTFIILSIIIGFLSCNTERTSFDFTIKGTVIGQDSGVIVYTLSPRVGDEIKIPFKNGRFEYHGKAKEEIFSSLIFYNDLLKGAWESFHIIIEPGISEVELNRDSIYEKSRVLQGKSTLKLLKVNKITDKYYDSINNGKNSKAEKDSLKKMVYSDSIANLIEKNKDNIVGVYLINRFFDSQFFNLTQKGDLLKKITDYKLRNSFYFKKQYSKYIAQRDDYNKTGTRAIDFQLQDSSGKTIIFSEIAKNKMIYIEESGSWCGNQTRETHKLDTIYKRFKDKGFEIITVVPEYRIDRWKRWLSSEKYPWINLVELDFDSKSDVVYCEQIFNNGDYLVDETGIVIANNLTPEKLYGILLKKYEPEEYVKYKGNMWNLPKNVFLLDKEMPINSFEELVTKFSDKAFFIDCYATWCSPCIKEFKYKDELVAYLTKHNIKLVYISFDSNLNDAKWLNFIKKYNLTGYHMRANQEFIDSFRQKTGFGSQLPSYLIINKDGEVVENNAFRPSNKEALFKQLESKLNE